MNILPVKGFKKVNEAVNAEILKADELTSLINMRLDEEAGTPTTRKGFSRYHSQVDTSGTINNLFDVVDKNDDNYLLASVGTKLRKSASGTGTWSDVKTGLTSAKMRMANYGGNFLFTNNNEAPFHTDDFSTVNDLAIERPDVSGITITLGTTASPVLSEGIYRYLLVYLTNDGQMSNPSIQFQPFYQASGYDDIFFSDLPVSSDTRVSKKMLFRTKVGTLSTFYLVASIDNADTNYNDAVADSDLDTTTTFDYLNTPNKSRYIIVKDDRIFFANINKLYTNRVMAPPYIQDDSSKAMLADSTGLIQAGTYKYAMSWVDNDGNESDLVPFVTYVLTTNDKEISFYILNGCALTTGAVNPRTDIKYIRIYRTKDGGSTYYYVGDRSAYAYGLNPPTGTSPFVDNVPDSSLADVYPKSGADNTDAVDLGYSVIFSNLSKYLEYPELNYIEIYPNDGDTITGMFDDDNGVIVFKSRNICKLVTNGDPSNWYVIKLVSNIGCDQPDTIYKYAGGYFFVFENTPYFYGEGKLRVLGDDGIGGFNFSTTFNSISGYFGATFWQKAKWYVLAVKISSTYYLLCYDTKLDGWYKFTVNQADCVIRRVQGSDKDKILVGGDTYACYYDESATSDTDSGSTSEISVTLKTSTFVNDDFSYMRFFNWYFNYIRLLGTTAGSLTFTITDAVSGSSNTFTDTTETLERIVKKGNDSLGSVKRVEKFYVTISGVAISKFISLKAEFIPESYGVNINA